MDRTEKGVILVNRGRGRWGELGIDRERDREREREDESERKLERESRIGRSNVKKEEGGKRLESERVRRV